MTGTMPQSEQLNAIVKSVRAAYGPFRPYAVFDEQLDCIRVVTYDCSANEIRVNELLTILEPNYPGHGVPDLVGFTIKGVAHICEAQGIPADAPWKLADFIDAIVKASPIVRFTVDRHVRPLVAQTRLEDVEKVAA